MSDFIQLPAIEPYPDHIFSETELTDVDNYLTPLGTSLFPGVPSNVEVHNGFQAAQEKTAAPVLSAVKSALSANSANSVTVVGHSLGAAIALLDTLYLRLQLPSSTSVKMVSYASPRVSSIQSLGALKH